MYKRQPQGPPGTRLTTPEGLFDVPIGAAIAVFLLLAALDHVATATFARGTYERDLMRGINRFRWVEYSVSATPPRPWISKPARRV